MDSKMKRSWEVLGVILANLGGLGRSFSVILAVLAVLEGLLERLGLVLGRLEGILDRLGGILGRLGGVLGPLGGLRLCTAVARWWARRGLLLGSFMIFLTL